MSEELKPCPFCGNALPIRSGVNSYGRCDTEGCWMHDRALTVPLDAHEQVRQWNTRAETPQSIPSEREEIVEYLFHLAEKTDAAPAFDLISAANAIERGEHLSTRPLEGDGE